MGDFVILWLLRFVNIGRNYCIKLPKVVSLPQNPNNNKKTTTTISQNKWTEWLYSNGNIVARPSCHNHGLAIVILKCMSFGINRSCPEAFYEMICCQIGRYIKISIPRYPLSQRSKIYFLKQSSLRHCQSSLVICQWLSTLWNSHWTSENDNWPLVNS